MCFCDRSTRVGPVTKNADSAALGLCCATNHDYDPCQHHDDYGDMTAFTLNGPVVASAATPTGLGYYMIGSDGGVFAIGDAKFVGADGGIFCFSTKPFLGSLGGNPPDTPIRSVAAFTN